MKISLITIRVAGVLAVLFVAGIFVQLRLRRPLSAMIAASPSVSSARTSHEPTVIEVSQTILRQNVIRLGMNLGGESFYDSQQILKNLVSQNPGFEGRQWQSVLRCGHVTATSCTDGANSGSWPEGFLDGGTYEVIYGATAGETGPIAHSTVASNQTGATIQFMAGAKPLAEGNVIVVRKQTAGHATDGWSPYLNGGATITEELKDLSPHTHGKQALRISALGAGAFAGLSTSFDSTNSRSYVQLRGPYVIRFRAKGAGGNRTVRVKLGRVVAGGNDTIFDQNVSLSGDWRDYNLNFNAMESTAAVGTVSLEFNFSGTEVLLDDVSLEEASSNGTAFRNDVVATLERLRPGVLRYMDSGQNFGNTLDNMLSSDEARQRSGFSRYATETTSVAIGLHDFLVLCEKLKTAPWYTMQLGMSTQEASNIMEYLGGPPTTKYGAIRAALGHPVPWTQTFPIIHLEYGNEAWNTAQPGASMDDPAPYASRATKIFATMRASKWYAADHFNLIADGQAVWAGRTQQLLLTMQGADMIDIAPYTFTTFADDTSIEHIFGPMFAEPQFLDDTVGGYVHQQANSAANAVHPARLAVYESNINTTEGTASQASLDATVPSLGAGIASVLHELLMLRDLGVTVQNTFQLGGGGYHFNNTAGTDKNEISAVWATVVDMGGPTNRVRPSFLAQQLVNEAMRPTMLATSVHGEDPIWNQPKSANDNIELAHVKELQSFAFTDSSSTSTVIVNLSRDFAHSLTLSGVCAPAGNVTVRTLSSLKITDSNESEEKVKIVTREEHNVSPGTVFSLRPFSMTSFSSSNHGCVPSR